jgi:branched-chain amino acid transport system permease protein
MIGWVRRLWEAGPSTRDPNAIVYLAIALGAVLFPVWVSLATSNSNFWIGVAADAGVFMLLALGLNVVVGFAGLLDLGYAAFFAIGAYTYAMIASGHGSATPLGFSIHAPFWIVLVLAMFVAASFGVILGAPTLRLRGDYLAIVTLGFGEIVPRIFRNANEWTSGVNGISALDTPEVPFLGFKIIDSLSYYVIMVVLIIICVVLVRNLQNSRMGRAWAAVREDEVAAAAMGVNTVQAKLLAFAIGAAFSGFAGTYYAAKLSLVSSGNFGFSVSITVLIMVVLGGMGNIAGVMVGSLLIYYVIFIVLPGLPEFAVSIVNTIGLGGLAQASGDYPGIGEMASRIKFLVFGLILVVTMLVRPQGLLPSRERAQELTKGTHEDTIIEDVTAEVDA